MSDQNDLTRDWLLLAENDLLAAEAILAVNVALGTCGFHAQKAVEKSLKAILAFHGATIPRTHNLIDLELAAKRFQPTLDLSAADLEWMTEFAVEIRYHLSLAPTRAEAGSAIGMAKSVRAAVLAVLPLEVH